MDVVSATSKSRFLSKEDAGDGLDFVIGEVKRENVSTPGKGERIETVIYSDNGTKPFICKTTNAKKIAQLVGSRKSEDWIGKTIRLVNDPSVRNLKGETVGGLRVLEAADLPF
jgi:hypothetical protein